MLSQPSKDDVVHLFIFEYSKTEFSFQSVAVILTSDSTSLPSNTMLQFGACP